MCWLILVIALEQTNLVTGQSKPLVAVKPNKKGMSLLKFNRRYELRVWCVCFGYKASAFVVGNFHMQSLSVEWQGSIV